MGTNFYLITKSKDTVMKYAPYSYEITDEPYFCYKFHVAKTSAGWLPLFQGHEDGINSVKEYKEAYDTGEFEIIDEYGDIYNWEAFDERVLKHNGGKLGVKEPVRVDRKFSVDGISIDPGIPEYTPISHIPGSKQSYNFQLTYGDNKTIYQDPEGYEFESQWFG